MRKRWLSSITNKPEQSATVSVPRGYHVHRSWEPAIGDIVPNFTCHSTEGKLTLFDYAEGHWTYLMNQPNAHGAVCTTEVASLAAAEQEFEARDCRILSITQERVEDEAHWIDSIETHFADLVWFPMVADPSFEISDLFGMTHWRQNEANAVRKTFLIDPALRVRMILEYPLPIGRSVTEMLRILDAQLMHLSNGVVTPCDWQPGDPALVPHLMSDQAANAKFGSAITRIAPGVRIVSFGSDNKRSEPTYRA